MATMKKKGPKQQSNKSVDYASKAPFKRGGFETKQRFNMVTPKLHSMTHDFLFRNVYKKPQALSDEKRNHPTSHYRYRFHHSNTVKARSQKHNEKQPNTHKKRIKTDANDDIPFYDDINTNKKEYLSDDELDIASSSNSDSSDNELDYEHYRKDSLKRKHENKKLTAKSKWLQSKIHENSELFEGGLDLQGRLPLKNQVKTHKFVTKNALVLGSVHSVHEHYVKLYLYGSIPGILTIREVSDVLSMEIDHLITNKNKKTSIKKQKKSLLNIKTSLETDELIAHKRMTQSHDAKHMYYYNTLEQLPSCHDLFKRNQIIRCVVTHRKSDGFHVSLRPSLFNRKLRMNDLIPGYALLCSIKSIEDKGYVIDTGIYVQDKGGENEIAVRSFMNYNDVDAMIIRKILRIKHTDHDNEDKQVFPIGFPLEVIVKKSDMESNSIWLTLDFKKYYRELTTLPIVPIAALKPGFTVQCHIKRLLLDGLVVEFGKVYQGVVIYSHMDKLLDKNWKTRYTVGQALSARIVLVHPLFNIIHLSIKPHLVQQSQHGLLPTALVYNVNVPRRCNEVITADVRRIAYDSLYLYTKLLDPVFVNKAIDNDEKEEDIDSDDAEEKKLFPALNKEPLQQMIPIRITQKHLGRKKANLRNPNVFDSWKNRRDLKVKLLRFDEFQGEFQGTLKNSEVEARVLFYKDIKYGMVFECTVVRIDASQSKINVTFCNGLTGHISILHCAEKPPKSLSEHHITSKYKTGNVIKCRVLTCIAYKKSVNLTAKPSLIDTGIDHKDPMTIYSWNTPRNVLSRGVIFKMNDVMGYIAVHFYNSVTAVIPSKDLKANGYLTKPSQEFYIGQTIQVRVLSCYQRNKRMICSMNLNIDDWVKSAEDKDVLYDGTLFWSKIVLRKDDCFIVKKLINYDENKSIDNDNEDDGIENEISFNELKLYSILPFEHLCDNSTQSVCLVESKAFDIGDKIQVLTIHRIKVTRPDIEKQLNFQKRVIESLGLAQDVVQFKDTDRQILSIVTAKTGLLRLHRKHLTPKVFPINTRNIAVGDELLGYVSSNRFPSMKHAMWIHFSGLLQLPVPWKYTHDLRMDTVRACIKMSFAANDSDNHEDMDLSIYKHGDLVMAKVMDITDLPIDEANGRHLVTLSMKPSDLYPHIPMSRQIYFCKTFINEWYLSYKQQQIMFVDKEDEEDEEEEGKEDEEKEGKEDEDSDDSDADMIDMEQKHDTKAVIERLQIGNVLQCRVRSMEDGDTILVEFVPCIEGVIGVIKVEQSRSHGMDIYTQRLEENIKFKCNILNIDWSEEEPIIELYDGYDNMVLDTIQDAAAHTFVIKARSVINNATIIYVSATYVLVEFAIFKASNTKHSKRYMGIVPMRLPYLIIPTTLMYNVGNEIDIVVIQASNHYGGVILCSLMAQSLEKYIKIYNNKMMKLNRKIYNKKKRKTDEIKQKPKQQHVQPSKKRKSDEMEHKAKQEQPTKKRKIMMKYQDIVQSAKDNILGTVYTAILRQSDADKEVFIINAKHPRLYDICDGILPFEQLCDNHDISRKLATTYHRLLVENKHVQALEGITIPVIITRVSDDDKVIFTAKNMIVSHCGNHAYPRFNAYQIGKKYRKIKRNVPMMGCIDKDRSEHEDVLTVFHGDEVISSVDYDHSLMLPFDRREVDIVYGKGQTVIGHIAHNSKLQKGAISMELCRLNKIETIDIMVSNESFMKEYQRMIDAKYRLNKENDNDMVYITNVDVHIGDVIDVMIADITATSIAFVYNKGIKGIVIRPEHSGAELDEFEEGMNIEIVVIDLDYDANYIYGSIRLVNKRPNVLNANQEKALMIGDKHRLSQLECISDNGYLVLQMIENNHFIVVPLDIPYFHLTLIQKQLLFKIGAKFKVSIIEKMYLNKNAKCKHLYLGHIPSLIKVNGGYLNTKMMDIISNPSRHYKPYDLRLHHPAQIIYRKKAIECLSIKLCKTTSQGHIAEFAPHMYPKIVIENDENNENHDTYLILEDKVENGDKIKVNLSLNDNIRSNDREIVISIDDVVMDDGDMHMGKTDIKMIDNDGNNNENNALKVGQMVDIVIKSISRDGVCVDILDTDVNRLGYIEAIHASDSIKDIVKLQTDPDAFLTDCLHVMMDKESCKAVIIDISDQRKIGLSLQSSMIAQYSKLQHLLTSDRCARLDIGRELNGRINKIVSSHGIFLDLGVFGVGELHITNAVNDVDHHDAIDLCEMFCVHDVIRCRVIAKCSETQVVHVSIKHVSNPHYIEKALLYTDLISGSLISGIVSMIDAKLGVIVWISRCIRGRISFKHLSANNDISYSQAMNKYKIGSVVHDMQVLFISSEQKRVELSLISSSHVDSKHKRIKFISHKLNDMAQGDFVTVIFRRKLQNDALSVYVPDSDFKFGIITKDEISQHLLNDNGVDKMIKGDKIQCWVSDIKPNRNNKLIVYFTMKSKSLKLNKSSADATRQQMRQIKQEKRRRVATNMMREYHKLKEMQANADEDGEDEDDDEEGEDIAPLDPDNNEQHLETTIRANAFVDDESDDDGDDDAMMETQQEAIAKEEEEEEEAESGGEQAKEREGKSEDNAEWNELMKSEGFSAKPRTQSDFERLLVSSPSSSIIWIEFIAFYLRRQNVVRARSVIKRALEEIGVSEDRERLNIWIAWMNLEMLYGTEDALIDIFRLALQSNDEKDVYTQFVAVCCENQKYDLSHKYYTEMIHKFSGDSRVYICYGRFLYQQFAQNTNMHYLNEARDLLKRAIQNLSLKAQHISVICEFAYNEYKYVNNKENENDIKNEGTAMYEGLLKKYKNRAVIWNVYANATYKFTKNNPSRLQNARDIFERGLIHKNMKINDTKWLFKRYLTFEKRYGAYADDHTENVAHIKQLAKQYVDTISK